MKTFPKVSVAAKGNVTDHTKDNFRKIVETAVRKLGPQGALDAIEHALANTGWSRSEVGGAVTLTKGDSQIRIWAED